MPAPVEPHRAEPTVDDPRGLAEAILADGPFLIILTGVSLVMAGGAALFLSATGHFLPHDIEFLGMTAQELCGINECRVVHFMFHDRVSFGGVLIAIGLLYMWLAEFPLRHAQPWAWWTLALSGTVGFASFLSYLGYGYLDTWHGVGTLLLLPCFVIGMARSWARLPQPRGPLVIIKPGQPLTLTTRSRQAQLALLLASLGIVGAGLTISTIGMTTVFVPQDLTYMGLTVEYLQSINPRLVPLIAHDRAGFGGGLCSGGIALALIVWCGQPLRSRWQILTLASSIGFTAAIAVHFVIGYDDVIHLAPACVGALLFSIGLVLTYRS